MKLFRRFKKKPRKLPIFAGSKSPLTIDVAINGYDTFMQQMAVMCNAVDTLSVKMQELDKHAAKMDAYLNFLLDEEE